ncbi:MAG: hypothetical protein HRU19_11000 [Pseudobacteriovorax sp.]|nr:hypothetical protein [Pseudobacteriovorax sp.]
MKRSLVACGWSILLSSGGLHAGILENGHLSSLTGLVKQQQFIYNPAELPINIKKYSVLARKDTRSTNVVGSPNNSNQSISYEYENDLIALGGLLPFGGGAFGFWYAQLNESLDTDNSAVGRVIEEKKKHDVYAIRFALELVPFLTFGFHYEYKKIANFIYGSFFLNQNDQTNYKAFISGYRLGLNYDNRKFALAAYTAPPLRGKALIDGEQKIVGEPGSGALSFLLYANAKMSLAAKHTQWFYKRDDRSELSTSPVDERDISLNGLELDQFLYPLSQTTLGVSYNARKHIFLKTDVFKQISVFHFDEDSLPTDKRSSDTRLDYYGVQGVITLEKNKVLFSAGLRLELFKEIDEISDNTGKLGHGTYVDYKSTNRNLFLSMAYMQ